MSAPSGWYPDPHVAELERYWDGAAWNDQTRARSAQTPTGPSRQERSAVAKDAKASAKEAAAFAESPVGQAVRAREDGQGFFETQLVVGSSQKQRGLLGTGTYNHPRIKTVTHAGTLAAIEAVGWRLEHVGYIFQMISQNSRDKGFLSGQQTAIGGQTVGIYLFRAVD